MHRLFGYSALFAVLASAPSRASEIVLAGSGLKLTFEDSAERLRLVRMERAGGRSMLYEDAAGKRPGAASLGNPLSVVVRQGPFKGIYGMDSFHLTAKRVDGPQITAYLQHSSMPLAVALQVSVEGAVAIWRGQVFWNGDEPIDLDIYYPLLSRVRFDTPERDRVLVAKTSGMTLGPLSTLNYGETYIGSLSAPIMILEGGGRGLAVIDDNRADYAPDPAATCQRGQVVGNTFPLEAEHWGRMKLKGGEQGPYFGIRHSRWFRAARDAGGEAEYGAAETTVPALPIRKLGDSVDLGPVLTYAYEGTWKQGAAWARSVRSWVPFRKSQPAWYRETTFIGEEMGDDLVRHGRTAYDFPKVLADRRKLGADVFHITGFHDPEVLGTPNNWLDRGDYFFAASNLGGPEAVRAGVEAVHRAGGHVLYYIEGLIVWKRSRVGRAYGKDWALLKSDGQPYEWYKGFWHACPASPEWQEWFARMAADVVRQTGVDGFFVDSLAATDYHRCFNPAHKHPHPDVWTWGVRQTLRRLREELDKVNPSAVIILEGENDVSREYADGFLAHGHFWNRPDFTQPLVRFLYPEMRAFESWGYDNEPERAHVWNAVNGHRIYAHNSNPDRMAALASSTRRYYDMYPEICDGPMSTADVPCDQCISQMFEGNRPIVTIGNLSPEQVSSRMQLPGLRTGVLFDRVTGERVQIVEGRASVALRPWDFRAFEMRP